jgi:glycosyltransferase involved in cell wall biosynthesis
MEKDISVLMSVYAKDKPEYLSAALESVFNQTLKPREVVLVKDGQLDTKLDETIKFWEGKEKGILKCIEIEDNIGLAHALNYGLENCSCELVARMDSDDICLKERLEKQIYFLNTKGVDVVGSYIEERDEKMKCVSGVREVPITHEKIVRYSKWRNPMNHMTVLFKKSAVIAVGGYPDEIKKIQDYVLWVKMIRKEYKFANLPESLVLVRTGACFLDRRGGLDYFKYDLAALNCLKAMKHIGFICFVSNVIVRFCARVSPVVLRGLIYKKMRKRPSKI